MTFAEWVIAEWLEGLSSVNVSSSADAQVSWGGTPVEWCLE